MFVGTPTMRDFKGDETPKLRRFPLTIGIVMFFYAVAGVEFKSPLDISPLGIPLTVLLLRHRIGGLPS